MGGVIVVEPWNVLTATELYLEKVKMVKFTLVIFYHSFKKWTKIS